MEPKYKSILNALIVSLKANVAALTAASDLMPSEETDNMLKLTAHNLQSSISLIEFYLKDERSN